MDFLIAQSSVSDSEFVKWLATLGVGGVLAALMFYFYRNDVKEYTESWKGQSELLMQVVKENTASNTRLIASIDSLQILVAQIVKEHRGKE